MDRPMKAEEKRRDRQGDLVRRRTLCEICTAGCMLDATVRDGRIVKVENADPRTGGRGAMCVKGAASAVFYCGYPKRFRPLLFSLAKAYGSPNYCTESSTCSHAVKMAWRACCGKSCPPDLSRCRSMLVWGANYPYSKLQDARRYQQALDRGIPMVCVDPRCTPMTERGSW